MRKFWLCLSVLMLFSIAACSSANVSIRQSETSRYGAGQVWTYKTRTGEGNSTITILRVDTVTKDGVSTNVVHVSIDKVNLTAGSGKYVQTIPFMSFEEKALEGSLVKLTNTISDLPDFQSGYDQWARQFRAGNESYFTVSPAKALDELQKSLDGAAK
jgi:hypothetical protein